MYFYFLTRVNCRLVLYFHEYYITRVCTNMILYSAEIEFFELYSAEIATKYGKVLWEGMPELPLQENNRETV